MSEFKVGDSVKRISGGGYGLVVEGGIYVVSGNPLTDSITVEGEDFHAYSAHHFELVWQPTNADQIEVRDEHADLRVGWCKGYFVGMDDDRFVVADCNGSSDYFSSWAEARPIKTTHTITDSQGRTAEISAESFKELDKLFS